MLILDQETINLVWKLHMDGVAANTIAGEVGANPTRIKNILYGRTYASLKPDWARRQKVVNSISNQEPDPIWG